MDLHKTLKGKKNPDGKLDFFKHIEAVKGKAVDWLDGIGKNGIEHVERLERHLNRLIPDKFKMQLKPAETFILLYAVYLHDIGYRTEDGTIDGKGHPERSKLYILKEPGKYLFKDMPRTAEQPPLTAVAVATVCHGHANESLCHLHDVPNDFPDENLALEPLNLRRLVALLRLVDETDQAYIRLETTDTVREHISLSDIIPGKITLRWRGNQDVGEKVRSTVEEINEILGPVNDCLAEWDGFPMTHVIYKPPVSRPKRPPSEPEEYIKHVPKHYIPPRCHDERGAEKGALAAYVNTWLSDPERRLLAVLGDFGMGKTSFCYKLASELLDGDTYVPVLIELRRVRQEGHGVIRQVLEMATTAGCRRVLVLLDGFDELSLAFDARTVVKEIENLSKDTKTYQKMILTSRTEFFNSVYEERHCLVDMSDGLFNQGPGPRPLTRCPFERIYISPFNEGEIRGYLEHFLGWSEADHFWTETIEKIYDMRDLSSRPILLNLIVENIDAIRDLKGTVTQGRLYQTITDNWRIRQGERTPENVMLFMEELSLLLFRSSEAQVHFKTLREAIKEYFDEDTKKRLRASLDNLDYQIRNCSFLGRKSGEGYFSFAHRSFMEYFVACKLAHEITKGKASDMKITDQIARFVSELMDPSIYERITPPAGIQAPEGMVFIPPGRFIMGNGDNIRVTNLKKGFFIDKFPVTNAQFAQFLNEKGGSQDEIKSWINLRGTSKKEWCRISCKRGHFVVEEDYNNHPVIYVSWNGAQAYAEWAGKRLATEQEWEKAARGIGGRVYPWGNEFDERKCNVKDSGIGGTTPVDRYLDVVSPFGCYDMIGNVEEWVDGWYDDEGKYRVTRGGSWDSFRGSIKSADRGLNSPIWGTINVGFRCVRTLNK